MKKNTDCENYFEFRVMFVRYHQRWLIGAGNEVCFPLGFRIESRRRSSEEG